MKLIRNRIETGIEISPDEFEHKCMHCRRATHFDISGLIPPEWVSIQCTAEDDIQKPAFCPALDAVLAQAEGREDAALP